MLNQTQIDIIINTFKPFNPKRIGVFGSYARDENTESSDIDILYSFKNTVGLLSLVAIKQDLEAKLQKKVDLVSDKYTNSKIKPLIMKDLKIIYEN